MVPARERLRSTAMPDVLLATGTDMPKADPESDLLIDALGELGLRAELVPWADERDWGAARLVVSRTPWDYFDRRDAFVAWAHGVDAVTRMENPSEVLAWNTHKGYLVELEAAGVPVVPTVHVPHGADDAERADALAEAVRRGELVGAGASRGVGGRPADGEPAAEVVIKPSIAGGAMDTERLPAADPRAAAHLATLAARGDVLVQPFVPSVAADGETSLILFDGAFSHAVRKIPAGGDFRVQENHGGTLADHEPTGAELDVANAVLRAAPAPTAYARIDLVELDGGPALMEAELVEPELFLRREPEAAERFARALAGRLQG